MKFAQWVLCLFTWFVILQWFSVNINFIYHMWSHLLNIQIISCINKTSQCPYCKTILFSPLISEWCAIDWEADAQESASFALLFVNVKSSRALTIYSVAPDSSLLPQWNLSVAKRKLWERHLVSIAINATGSHVKYPSMKIWRKALVATVWVKEVGGLLLLPSSFMASLSSLHAEAIHTFSRHKPVLNF